MINLSPTCHTVLTHGNLSVAFYIYYTYVLLFICINAIFNLLLLLPRNFGTNPLHILFIYEHFCAHDF